MEWLQRNIRHQMELRVPRQRRPKAEKVGTSFQAIAKELFRKFNEDNVLSLAAAFAYRMVFAAPAMIILTITIAAVVDQATSVDVASQLRTMIRDHAPAETSDLLNSIVDNAIAKVGTGRASVGVAVTAAIALWSGSSGIGSLMDSFNRAYGVRESRPFVQKRMEMLGLTLLLTLAINLAFVLLIYGQRIGHWLVDRWGMGSLFDTTLSIVRWPIAIGSMMVMLAVLYYVGPNVELSFRWISPGSVLATFMWFLAAAGFGLYLTIGNPGSAYGALGSVLVFLFFLYITGAVFILGAELNAVIGKRWDPAAVQDLATTPNATLETHLEEQQRLAQLQ
jgi:membrane protein